VASVDTPIRDEGASLAPKPRAAVAVKGARTHFRRFTAFQRWVHFFIMISFSTLVLTGMPLKYSDKAWAQTWMGFIGGVENAGMIHRFAALIMVASGFLMVLFFLKILIQYKGRYWGPGTMVPTRQDYRDLKANVSWFLGRGPRPKLQLDRYAYYEKGEFWAASGGCSIMIVTGAILWYPEVASRFLPGIVINFALINHSGGALLAMGFVVVFWHFFHAHLRPEAFPMDKAMYAGGLPLEEYAHERPVEYERLMSEGKLEQALVAPVSERRMKVQNVVWWIITGLAMFLWAVFCIFVVWVTYNWIVGF
jgi:cytochrome b subunit of formate dehydrogenase